jgi:tight adherence protein B
MLITIIFVVLFVTILTTVGVGLKIGQAQRRKKVAAILKTAPVEQTFVETNLLSRSQNDGLAWMSNFLRRFDIPRQLGARIQQAGMTMSPEKFIGASAALAVMGFFIGYQVTVLLAPLLSAIALALLLGLVPHFVVGWKRSKRMRQFEEQFPEALDFLSRAMRAGHAFSVSLELLADESLPPLSVEFRKVFNEQNLGSPLDTALRNLAQRVPIVDVSFFVSAVLLQRETGGNLSEVLNCLSQVIRQRFQLKGHVRAASASAKMTGTVLTILPLALAALLNVVNPGYLQGMVDDPTGQKMIMAAFGAQIVGYLSIRKIVNFQV